MLMIIYPQQEDNLYNDLNKFIHFHSYQIGKIKINIHVKSLLCHLLAIILRKMLNKKIKSKLYNQKETSSIIL